MDSAERHLRHRIRMLRALRAIVCQKQEQIAYVENGLLLETLEIKYYGNAIRAALRGLDNAWITIDVNLRRHGWCV